MNQDLYFDKNKLPQPKGEYVLWCDGMGTGQELHRNLERSAVFVFKLHMAFAKAREKYSGVNFYPVMDGMYITTESRTVLEDLICDAFLILANDFISANGTKNMFMVRGGIAYGPVIHGKDIDDNAFKGIAGDQIIKNAILLSPAMVSSNKVESLAPPFGIYVDDSAKVIPVLANAEDKGFISSLYQWWAKERHTGNKDVVVNLYHNIKHYMDKAKIHSVGMNYPLDRIETHSKLAEEYFGGIMPNSKDNAGFVDS